MPRKYLVKLWIFTVSRLANCSIMNSATAGTDGGKRSLTVGPDAGVPLYAWAPDFNYGAMAMKKADLLKTPVNHYDIKTVNVVPMIDMMEKTAFQARNLARAAK